MYPTQFANLMQSQFWNGNGF